MNTFNLYDEYGKTGTVVIERDCFGRFVWSYSDSESPGNMGVTFSTNQSGEGVWEQRDNAERKQVTGTIQFQAGSIKGLAAKLAARNRRFNTGKSWTEKIG